MSIIRTDAGLIYNIDGSLCVTLLPEGGVAIDEENIIEGQPVPIPGNLQIPTGPPTLSMLESGTIAFTIWTPKTSWGTGHDALIDVGGILQLKLDGNGIEGFTIIPNVKYKMAITWQNGQNTKLYLLREGEMLQKSYDTVYSEAGDGIIRFGRFKDNVNSTNTIRIKDLLIQATAISFETVKTWFGIKGPFFDPGEHYDATARPIYAPGVVIDSTGAWGIANGVKQAGFGTDGKQIAGGGRVVSDIQGLRTYDKPYTDPTAVKQVEVGTDGALMFGSGAGRADAQGILLYDISDPQNPKPMIRLVGQTGTAEFEGAVRSKVLIIPVGTDRWG